MQKRTKKVQKRIDLLKNETFVTAIRLDK